MSVHGTIGAVGRFDVLAFTENVETVYLNCLEKLPRAGAVQEKYEIMAQLQKLDLNSCRLRVLRGLLFMLGMTAALTPAAESDVDRIPQVMEAAASADPVDRIAALRAEIGYHDERYFKQASPLISDVVYDQLKRELAALERADPGAAQEAPAGGSALGDDRSGFFKTRWHREPMLSLNKAYSEAEVREFDARIRKQAPQGEIAYVVEPKFDGVAISVTYEMGRLAHAVTRGNGREGDDVTATVRAIGTLPANLKGASFPAFIELRGEIFFTFEEFDRINHIRIQSGQVPFANPRNLAAGTLKQTDPVILADRHLSIVFYGLGACEPGGAGGDSEIARLRQFHAWGLPTLQDPKIVRGFMQMWAAVSVIRRGRTRLGLPIDGVVVKVNDGALQQQLGASEYAPAWAIAYKFEAERQETKLRAISWQPGRTGLLTPVAELAPVKFSGSTVTRASVFNGAEIRRLDLRIGDSVYVDKAGDVIPVIAGVNLDRRQATSVPYLMPQECPVCKSPVEQSQAGGGLYCPKSSCPAQLERRVLYYASKECVGINGMGPRLVKRLVARKIISSVADLYRLRPEDLTHVGVIDVNAANRLLAVIERSKQVELWRIICGLGIPDIGAVNARKLGCRFNSLKDLLDADTDLLTEPDASGSAGLRSATVGSLRNFLAREENRQTLRDLASLGVASSDNGRKDSRASSAK